MSFVGAHSPRLLTTEIIAKWVDTHATRVRQLVSLLVKAGLLAASRGGGGGVRLAKSPNDITLLDVYEAIGDTEMLQFSMDNPFSQWSDHCSVHSALTRAQRTIEENLRKEFETIKLSDVFVPWDNHSIQQIRIKQGGTLEGNSER